MQVGDIAGVGCFTDSCRSCEECKDGDENLCTGPGGMQGTYGSACAEAKQPGGVTQGGYSGDIVVDESYVIKVPENMHVAAAAPLLCAGITCYSPFINHGIKAGQNLGVVGLGGLGHMAVKIGAAMGCNVTVITRDESKRELALSFGAKNVIISTDKVQMDAAAKSLHFIYNSIAFAHDIHPYLDLLKSNGTMIMVGGVPKGSMPAGSFYAKLIVNFSHESDVTSLDPFLFYYCVPHKIPRGILLKTKCRPSPSSRLSSLCPCSLRHRV